MFVGMISKRRRDFASAAKRGRDLKAHLTAIMQAGLIALTALSFLGCDRSADVTFRNREALQSQNSPPAEKSLKIAVASMITPRAGFAYYRELLDYVGEKLGTHVVFIGRDKYAEVNELLEKGTLDVAFVCSGPYVEGHEKFGLELLVVPEVRGKTVYNSYIIVHKDSPVKDFGGLRGKVFAFTDPDSNSGKLAPTYFLSKMSETPDTYFSKYYFSYSHDKSIKAVADKLVDGAAVDSLVWNYFDKTDPGDTSKTKIILESEPFGIPPVVVRPGLEERTKRRLKEIFLKVHEDEKGRKILMGMLIDKFVAGRDADYDTVREMSAFVAGRKK